MKLNKKTAYAYGVLYGDGCITKKRDLKDKSKIIKRGLFLRTIDKDFAIAFAKALINYNPKVSKRIKDTLCFGKIYKNHAMYEVAIYNTKLASKFNKHPIKLPNSIKHSNIDLKKQFIKGVMDSEGYIGFHKRKELKRGYNYSMGIHVKDKWLFEFRDLVGSIGIKANKVLTRKNGSYYFHINMWDYYDSGIGFSIKRKQDRLNDFAQKVHRTKGQHRVFNFTKKDEKYIIKSYLSGKSMINIGAKFDCKYKPILRVLKENNIVERYVKWRRNK